MITNLIYRNLHKILLGACLMCASVVAYSFDEMRIGRKSAEDAFGNHGVVQLLKAVIRKDRPEAKRLIADGVNINAVGEGGVTPVLWVFGAHDVEAMKILLDLGADPDRYEPVNDGEVGLGPPSWIAAGGGQKEVLQLLLDHSANPNLVFGNKSLLLMAVQEGHLDCAELLLSHGADINYFSGPLSVFFATMTHGQFSNAIWTLNHGYTHNLTQARRLAEVTNPRPGQEEFKVQTLEIIDRLLGDKIINNP